MSNNAKLIRKIVTAGAISVPIIYVSTLAVDKFVMRDVDKE